MNGAPSPLHPEPAPRVPLRRVQPQGWVRNRTWGHRLYIVAMLVLVAIGFLRGMR